MHVIEEAESIARQRGYIGLWLDTFEFQARPFYEKLGFTVKETVADYYKSEQVSSAWLLEKSCE